MMKLLTKAAKGVAFGAALLTSTSALAQWQGTWDTSYGQIKLQQSQMFVYGDYGNWGTIEATASADRRTLRGIYRRKDDGSWGYFEWYRTSSKAFNGRWARPNDALPQWRGRGTTWTGSLLNSSKPNLAVYSGSSNIGIFMGSAPEKFKQWYSDLYSTGQSRTAQASQSIAAKPTTPAVNSLSKRFPKLRDYQPSAEPRWIEIELDSMNANGQDDAIYGLVGLYAYCVDGTKSTRLASYAGLKGNVFDRPRGNPLIGKRNRAASLGNDAVRKFPIDPTCLRSPDARIKIQIQTNLKQKKVLRDEVFGYRAFNFFVDQIPHSQAAQYFARITDGGSISIDPDSSTDAPFVAAVADRGRIARGPQIKISGQIRFTD